MKCLDNGWFRLIVFLMSLGFFAFACTENDRAKNWGGTAKYCLGAGEKLVNVTWKDEHLWLLTRAVREGEKPERYKFEEQSSFGVMQGTVVVTERAAGDKGDCK